VASVDEQEVLLLWRALSRFRSGGRPDCRPRGRHRQSDCPLLTRCPRWSGPDDRELAMHETFDETERRRESWPCSRLLGLLGPTTTRIDS
jgi:hypothetical protein